jgi:hypothetical protein
MTRIEGLLMVTSPSLGRNLPDTTLLPPLEKWTRPRNLPLVSSVDSWVTMPWIRSAPRTRFYRDCPNQEQECMLSGKNLTHPRGVSWSEFWFMPPLPKESILQQCYIRNTTSDSDGFRTGFRQRAQPLSTFHFLSISNILPRSLTVAYSQPSVIASIPAYCNRGFRRGTPS